MNGGSLLLQVGLGGFLRLLFYILGLSWTKLEHINLAISTHQVALEIALGLQQPDVIPVDSTPTFPCP